jgi:hypothetical protein
MLRKQVLKCLPGDTPFPHFCFVNDLHLTRKKLVAADLGFFSQRLLRGRRASTAAAVAIAE